MQLFSLIVVETIILFTPVHLKVQGVRTADHPIKEELERVKQYFQKIEDVEKQIGTLNSLSVE